MVSIDPAGSPVVLVIDDDEDVRNTYELWLDHDWETYTAEDGQTALSILSPAVDVVVLDRMMPGLSGGDVLDAMQDREADPRVVLVTAVSPEPEIVETPFDAYLPKPVDREELNETVRKLLGRDKQDDRLREYYRLVEKRATLETEIPEHVLVEDERYEQLTYRIAELEEDLNQDLNDLDSDEFVALIDDVV
ncbi:response regulator [Halolamina salifodinae]|uniref:DNA-binding response OmpR family regulator n=1 Tax=Halolamina salifodinae TaxID=1202767 RepID=A0A8T4GWJ7_9EURY|nr:response regulator [Halolamina salifodinae]MBP1987377.1 DNA-binding response OmpR family regulator [Halolamina salifodinae]